VKWLKRWIQEGAMACRALAVADRVGVARGPFEARFTRQGATDHDVDEPLLTQVGFVE